MKIIKSKSPLWTKEFTCKECDAVLEVEIIDLKVRNDSVEYGEFDLSVYFECLVCESQNDVTEKIPSGLKHRMFMEYKE